jgi:hypothetical protein
MEDEGSIDLSEMFMSSSLDPRIESVMPILAKLSKNLNEMSEVSELSEWADSLIEGGGGGEASEEPVEPMISEEESLTSNNPQGIPESEDDLDEGVLDTLKKVGNKVLDKLGHEDDVLKDLQKKAGIPAHAQHGKPNMAHPKDEERIEEVDMGQADSSLRNQLKQNDDKMDHYTALNKASKKMGHDHYMDVPDDKLEALKAMVKRFRTGEEVDESALQAYLGDKKYGKDGMDALRDAGRDHASEKTMQNIRAKYSSKEEVAEKFDPLKHIDKDKQTPDIKKAAKDVKQGSYADRAALMKAGGVKDDRGPRGVTMAEGQEDLDTIRRLLGK